jgi:hypothetical protein
MNIKKIKPILILLLFCFLLNAFTPKMIAGLSCSPTFSKAIKYQSILLCYTSMSYLTLKVMNNFFAKAIGLEIPEEGNFPGQKGQANREEANDSSDYYLANSGITENAKRFDTQNHSWNSLKNVFNLSAGAADYKMQLLFKHGHLMYIYCLFILLVFFLLPRGAIDASIIINRKI